MAADRSCLRLVVDRRVSAELARDEGAFLRPARDPRHAAAFDARDLHGDLPHAAGGGRDQHAIVRSQPADVAQPEIGRDGAQARAGRSSPRRCRARDRAFADSGRQWSDASASRAAPARGRRRQDPRRGSRARGRCRRRASLRRAECPADTQCPRSSTSASLDRWRDRASPAAPLPARACAPVRHRR